MNTLYPTGAAHMLGDPTQVDLIADDIILLLYTGSFSSGHEFIDDLVGTIVARSGNLSGKTVTDGVFDANNLTLTAVSGAAFAHVVLAKDSGADATSPNIAFFDVALFTPNGTDINVVFNVSGLFSIAT